MGDSADVTLLQTGFTEMRTRNRREGSYTSYGHAMVIYLLRNISRPRLPLLIASIQFILLYLRAFVFNVDNFGIGDIEFSSSLMTHG